jgi:hypothetical protein
LPKSETNPKSEIRNRALPGCSAGFQTCCIADGQIGAAPEAVRSAGLEIRDTADLEVCATSGAAPLRGVLRGFIWFLRC